MYDCIIIGGGILGSFHAYYAAKMKIIVLILEKDAKT
ncbi:MAG: FAD-dependent oxidoreductase [Bacteroidetes bacterium]|nr:FAD-dependent oxidoreductase [Bacteroidota bacterium]